MMNSDIEALPADEAPSGTYPQVDTETVLRTMNWSIAFSRRKGPMYEGTVPWHVKQKRRSRGKMAKTSRKRNRP